MFASILTFALPLLTISALTSAQLPSGGTDLPSYIVASVIDVATGDVLGTLNGYGNFSSPGPSYPMRSEVQSNGFDSLSAYGDCYLTTASSLNCYETGTVDGVLAEFYELNGLVALDGTGTSFSVDALTDAAGGVNEYGQSWGIPVYAGDLAAIPVYLSPAAAQG